MFCTFTSPAFDLQETYVLFLQPAVALGCIDLQEIPISWLNNIPMKMEAAKWCYFQTPPKSNAHKPEGKQIRDNVDGYTHHVHHDVECISSNHCSEVSQANISTNPPEKSVRLLAKVAPWDKIHPPVVKGQSTG